MTENLLFLANRGIDVIRLDAIPYKGATFTGSMTTSPSRSTPGQTVSTARRSIRDRVWTWGRFLPLAEGALRGR